MNKTYHQLLLKYRAALRERGRHGDVLITKVVFPCTEYISTQNI